MAKKKQFVKGSKEAKAFMAKLRAKRKAKVSGEKESTAIKNYLEDRNQRLTHGYHTQPDISAGARKLKAKQYKKHVLKEASKLKKQKPFKARKLSGSSICGINIQSALNKLYSDFGRITAHYMQAPDQKTKRMFKRHLNSIKKEISKIKKLK